MMINEITEGDPEEIGPALVRYDGALQGLCDYIQYADDAISSASRALDYIINMHPFIDGNKRTATLTAIRFLKSGNLRINLPQDDIVDFVRLVAIEAMDASSIEEWMRANVVALNPSASRRGRHTR